MCTFLLDADIDTFKKKLEIVYNNIFFVKYLTSCGKKIDLFNLLTEKIKFDHFSKVS